MNKFTPFNCGLPAILRQEVICPTWVNASANGPLIQYQKGSFREVSFSKFL